MIAAAVEPGALVGRLYHGRGHFRWPFDNGDGDPQELAGQGGESGSAYPRRLALSPCDDVRNAARDMALTPSPVPARLVRDPTHVSPDAARSALAGHSRRDGPRR